MTCQLSNTCGGCQYRDIPFKEYIQKKMDSFQKNISHINQADIKIDEPFFIEDGHRRRASFSFEYKKKKLVLGFNQKQSNQIIDLNECALLTSKINQNIPQLRQFITELCQVTFTERVKKKITTSNITKGSVFVCEVDNGLDIILEFPQEANYDIRQITFEFAEKNSDVIRISHKFKEFSEPETLIEKSKPYIKISDINVYIPAGTFLQASKKSETILIDLVQKYIGNSEGNIVDLFCGVGTFSYPLSHNLKNKILSIDSSKELLEGFKQSINKNIIPNIKIEARNLFKYPLLEDELKNVDILIFDPPRAGAASQIKHIKTPSKIIAISCNPNTFINDANQLISNGYKLENITLVDQFTYSPHTELVALFLPNHPY